MLQPLIGFAGMSHLGMNTAVATAERGFNTICYDIDESLIEELKNKELTIVEPELSKLFEKNISIDRLKFTFDANQLYKCDIIYISSDVMTDDSGISDLFTIKSLIKHICRHINPNAILVILCQVPPGFTRSLKEFIPLSRLYYQVETLIFGKAMERALFPERFIIGCVESNIELNQMFIKLLRSFECPILTMNYESAELTKISINCYLVSHVSVTNMLSELCEKIGANWFDIVPALKLDKRIGQYSYIMPGLGIAGGNLERDMTTVLNLSEQHGTDNGILKAWIDNSQYRKDWVLKIFHQKIFLNHSNPVLAILGLTYKENTNSTKNSPALALLECLKTYILQVYDPTVETSIVPWACCKLSIEEAIKGAHVLIIMTPWEAFKSLTPNDLKKYMSGNIIIDPYHVLNNTGFLKAGFQYFALGKSLTC